MKAMIFAIGLLASSVQASFFGMGAGFLHKSHSQVVGAQGGLMHLPMDAPQHTLVVKLERVDANNVADKEGAFYVGHIDVGQPAQSMTVLFHTSSGNVVLPHIACDDVACVEHKRYSPWSSKSAMDVQLNGELVTKNHRFAQGTVKRQIVRIDYSDSERGEGEARSVIVRDHICLNSIAGEKGCVDLELLAATNLPEHPFQAMPSDGIVGLGMEGLAASPVCSFFGQFAKDSRMLLQFGVSFGPEDGEILFGGHDESLYISPLRWLPVAKPEQGFWQVNIREVRIGSTVIDSCEKGCRGVVDTGAHRMGIKDSQLEQFKTMLQSHIVVDEGCSGPELIFDMGDFTLSLPPNDYTDSSCVPELGPLEMDHTVLDGVYSLGAPLLRYYYAGFDWDSKRIGFARSTKAPAPKAVARGLRR